MALVIGDCTSNQVDERDSPQAITEIDTSILAAGNPEVLHELLLWTARLETILPPSLVTQDLVMTLDANLDLITWSATHRDRISSFIQDLMNDLLAIHATVLDTHLLFTWINVVALKSPHPNPR